MINGKKEYYVKWKGFSENDNTWEPLSNLDACAKMIKKYDAEHQNQEEKTSSNGRSPKPERRKGKAKDELSSENTKPASEKKRILNEIDDDRPEVKFDVTKRTKIDEEIVFKAIDLSSKKEVFMTRKDLLREDPVALCLFYEKHIVS